MNRRDFMKLIPATLLAFYLKPKEVKPMALSDLMEKLAKGMTLNPLELSQLNQEFKAVEEVKNLVKGWVVPGTSQPVFISPITVVYSKILEADTDSVVIRIPSDYKHLIIMGQGRTDQNSGGNVWVQFNGDTGSNYEDTYLKGNAGGASAGQGLALTHIPLGMFSNSGDAAGSASSFDNRIPHYGSSFTKYSLSMTYYNDGTTRDLYVFSGKWLDTDPIESMEIYATNSGAVKGSAKMEAGSVISVYGLV